MSIRALSAVLDRFPRGGSEKLVLVTLADWCDDQGGNLYPSIQAVADKACIAARQTQRIMHALIDDGLLFVVGNEHGGAPGSTRRYRLAIEKIEAMPKLGERLTGDTHVTGDKAHTGDMHDTGVVQDGDGCHPRQRGVTSKTQTGVTHVTQSVSDPSENHQASIRKTRPTRREHELAMLIIRGVDPKHAADWLTIRGKHELTETALAGVEREAALAGKTLADAVRIAAENSWRGFNASWLTNRRPPQAGVDASNDSAVREWLGKGGAIEGEVINA